MFLSRFLVKMAANNAVLNRLEQKGAEADQVIEYLKQQVALLKEKAILQASLREEKKLRVENAKLKKEIEGLKQELIQAEIRNGVKQVAVPPGTTLSTASFSEDVPQPTAVTASSGSKDQIKGEDEEKKKKEKVEKKGEKKEKKQQPAAGNSDAKPVDVSRLDLRVGCIITAEKHPDADTLYVEQVDVGEASPRTVVSGLVKHVPLDKMQNRMAVLLCNLKPAKMRGVVSQAMVMCASSPEKVEILAPPPGAVPGERITFEGFPGDPEKELNPKKKIWEQIQPDLHTNDHCVATYKGVPFEVKGKGVCRAETMAVATSGAETRDKICPVDGFHLDRSSGQDGGTVPRRRGDVPGPASVMDSVAWVTSGILEKVFLLVLPVLMQTWAPCTEWDKGSEGKTDDYMASLANYQVHGP